MRRGFGAQYLFSGGVFSVLQVRPPRLRSILLGLGAAAHNKGIADNTDNLTRKRPAHDCQFSRIRHSRFTPAVGKCQRCSL